LNPAPLPTSLSHAEFRSTRHFANLDGLRALSVLAVLLFHFDALPWAWLRPLQQAGFFGVDVFFVLSGFLITTLLLREPERPIGTALLHFYARRTLRIFPLFYVACGLYALAALLRGGDTWAQYREFLPSLLFYWSDLRLAAHPEPFPYFGHAWSLAVEEKFYLLWPFAALAWRRAHGRTIALSTIVGVTVWRCAVALGEPESPPLLGRLWYSFDLRIDSLMWGCLLAYLLHEPRSYERTLAWLRRPWVVALALFGAAAVALDTVLHENDGLRLCVRYALMPMLLVVVLGHVVTAPMARGLTWLRWQPLVFVGRISYGVYVLHPLALFAVHQLAQRTVGETPGVLPTAVRLVAYTALALAISAVSFRWFEAPLLRMKRRFR
jgi:peptidoglycan/LPS O-acetylase OafA/YrhL